MTNKVKIIFSRFQSRVKSASSDELLIRLLQLITAFRFQDAYIALVKELNEINEHELFDRLHHHKRMMLDLQRGPEEISDIGLIAIKGRIKAVTSFPKIIKFYLNAFFLKFFYRVDPNQERSIS